MALERPGLLLDLVQRGIAQRPLRAAEPLVRPTSGRQRDLEKTVQHWVQRAFGVTQDVGLADLVQHLVLTQDGALKAAGHADQVTCRGGVIEALSTGWQLWKVGLVKRVESDIELNAVAGVHDDHGVIGLQCVALGGERLAGNAGNPPRVGDECDDGGWRCLDRGARKHFWRLWDRVAARAPAARGRPYHCSDW